MYFCMVCLNCDVKLFGLKDNSIGDIYSALTQIQVANWNQHVCFECAALLQKYHQFKLRCIRADKRLSETVIMPEVGKCHLQTLQKHYNLASNLGFSEIVTEDLIETNHEVKTDNLNNNGNFILLSNDEENIPSCVETELEKTHYDRSEYKDKASCNRLLSISVEPDGKIICELDTNKPKANNVISETSKPSIIHSINKNDQQEPRLLSINVPQDGKIGKIICGPDTNTPKANNVISKTNKPSTNHSIHKNDQQEPRLLLRSVAQDGKIICGQDTNKPKANNVISKTNKPSTIHTINKNGKQQPGLLSISVSQDGKIICGQDTKKPKANNVISKTNKTSKINTINKNGKEEPKFLSISVAQDGKLVCEQDANKPKTDSVISRTNKPSTIHSINKNGKEEPKFLSISVAQDGKLVCEQDANKPKTDSVISRTNKPSTIHSINKNGKQEPRLLSISVSQDGKIVCGQDTNKHKADNVINENDEQESIVDEAEISMISSDDESYHSDTSWTTILNTLNRIKNINKELTSNNKENVCIGESEPILSNISPLGSKNFSEITNNTVEGNNVTLVLSNKLNENVEEPLETTENDVENFNAGVKKKLITRWETTRQEKFLKKYGTVVHLTQEQATSDLLARQHSDNYCYSKFKCNICFKGFLGKNAYDYHMFTHNPKRGIYECDYCHFRCHSKRSLTNHLQTTHMFKFTCGSPQCSFVSNVMNNSTRHVINKHKNKGKIFKCKYCEAKFGVATTLSLHINRMHTSEFKNEYSCEFCGRIFYHKQGLSLHKKSIHFKEINDHQGPECKECNVHFASEQAWNLHLVLSRKHEVANACKICGKSFDNNDDLKSHSERHAQSRRETIRRSRLSSRNGPYHCQFCNFVTNFISYYKIHLHKIHGQPIPEKQEQIKSHICEFCGDKFRNPATLRAHIMKHTGERPFKCQYCEKAFRFKTLLKDHENLHTRAALYKCDVCDREFLRKTTLVKHSMLHNAHTPHKCLDCGQGFIVKSILKSHIRHKHEKVPYPPRKNPRYKKPKHLESVAEENIETSIIMEDYSFSEPNSIIKEDYSLFDKIE